MYTGTWPDKLVEVYWALPAHSPIVWKVGLGLKNSRYSYVVLPQGKQSSDVVGL